MKICGKCNKEKDENLFTTRRRSKDGLDTYCKECNDQYRKKYFSIDENKKKKKQNSSKV